MRIAIRKERSSEIDLHVENWTILSVQREGLFRYYLSPSLIEKFTAYPNGLIEMEE